MTGSATPIRAEVNYWTAVDARCRGVASAALEAVTAWAFDSFSLAPLRHIKLVHSADNYSLMPGRGKGRIGIPEDRPSHVTRVAR